MNSVCQSPKTGTDVMPVIGIIMIACLMSDSVTISMLVFRDAQYGNG